MGIAIVACRRRRPNRVPAGILILVAMLGVSIAGCIDESPTTVSFDQVIESTTFTNRLLTPIILFRNDAVLDTLPAQSWSAYSIGRKGVVKHAWRILAPLDDRGLPAGIQPLVTLGVQYQVRGTYTIDNESIGSETIFTPRVSNLSRYDLRLTANYQEEDQFNTDYVIRSNTISSLTHAPYYYWNSDSNVLLTQTPGFYSYLISRNDTNDYGQLRLDNGSGTTGSGATEPIVIY